MLKCIEEVRVHILYLFTDLIGKHLTLNDRVILLRICRRNFLSIDAKLEHINRAVVIHCDLRQWAELLRNVCHKGRLNQSRLNNLLKDIVRDLVIFELTVDFYI